MSAVLTPRADGALQRQPLSRTRSELETYASTQNYGAQNDPSEDGRNFVQRVNGGNVLYVSLDRMSDDDFSKPFAVFERELFAALEEPGAQRVIIDLRRNGGGDNTLAEPLPHRIQRSRFNRPGGIYVLTAPHTFSAAQNLANRFERETFAVFVGEPTGSCPNHCGDATQFETGRVTNVPVQVSTVRWMDAPPFDRRRWIMPDVLTPSTFADYVAGRDRAFEAALNHHDERPLDDALLTAPWQRASQAQDWRPFWRR